MVINETGDIVADVEYEPDRGKSRDAVKINLHEVSNDVSIEKSHCDNHGADRDTGVKFGSSARNARFHAAAIDVIVILSGAKDLR